MSAFEYLSSNLTKSAHDYLFGNGKLPSTEDKTSSLISSEFKEISIYYLTSRNCSTDNSDLLHKLWSCVPCRQFLIKQGDLPFVSSYSGSCSLPFLSMLRGAVTLDGFPVFVICFEEIVEYIGTSSHGDIICDGVLQLQTKDDLIQELIKLINEWCTKTGQADKKCSVVITGEGREEYTQEFEKSSLKEICDIKENKHIVHYGLSEALMTLTKGISSVSENHDAQVTKNSKSLGSKDECNEESQFNRKNMDNVKESEHYEGIEGLYNICLILFRLCDS